MTIYAPPRGTFPNDYLHYLSSLNDTIIIGDLNSHHTLLGDYTTNRKGQDLIALLQNTNLKHINTPGPTRLPSQENQRFTSPDKILISQNIRQTITHIALLEPPNTDHMAIQLNIFTPRCKILNLPEPKTKYKYQEADWTTYKDILEQKTETLPNNIQTTFDLEQADQKLLEAINEARHEAIPSSTIHKTSIPQRQFPKYVLDIIKTKRRAQRLYTKRPTEDNRRLLRQLQNDVQNSIKHFETARYNDYIDKLNTNKTINIRNFWNAVARLRRIPQNTHPLKHNGKYIYTDREKAEVLGQTLYETFQPRTDEKVDREHINTVTTFINTNRQLFNHLDNTQDEQVQEITMEELDLALKKTKNTSPGPDNIPYTIFRNLPNQTKQYLLDIFNASIKLGYLPTRWKKADIILFPKPGKDLTNPTNYRPISLIPTISKILERILTNRLHPLIQHILPPTQAGFRPGYDITDQIVRLMTDLQNETFNHRRTTTLAALDIKRAFDTVWLDGLRYKLAQTNLPTYLIRWTSDYIRDRAAIVKFKNGSSETFQLRAGTPQGGVLSPLLYILYVHDIPQPTIPHTGISQFADDTLYWASDLNIKFSTRKLNDILRNFTDWTNKWRIEVNADKTQTLTIKKKPVRPRLRDEYTVQINDIRIPYKQSITYLGYTLSYNLKPKKHIDKIHPKINRPLNAIRYLTKTSPKYNKHIPLLLYKTIVRPIILYAAPLIININKTQMHKLEVKERKITRQINKIPRYTNNYLTYIITNITPLNTYLKENIKKYYNKANTRTLLLPLLQNTPPNTILQDIKDLTLT